MGSRMSEDEEREKQENRENGENHRVRGGEGSTTGEGRGPKPT